MSPLTALELDLCRIALEELIPRQRNPRSEEIHARALARARRERPRPDDLEITGRSVTHLHEEEQR